MEPRADAGVELLGSRVLGLDLDPADRPVGLVAAEDVPAVHLRPVALHGERTDQAVIRAEVHGEPAVVRGRLPVARAPGAIAKPEAVDRVVHAVDDDAAARAPVLLEVPARELVTGPLVPDAHPAPLPPLARLAAVRRRDAFVDQIHLDGALRVLAEGTLRVDEVERPAEEHSGAVVPHAVLAHRRADLEAHAGRVEARVVGDLGPREHERDPPVGQVEAERHLGVTLVRPVADAGEAAETAPGVVEVVVGALVVVLLARVRMHQVIGIEENELGGHGPKLGGLALCFQAARPWQSAARAIDHRA